MPTYVFRCDQCDSVFERALRWADAGSALSVSCPQCESPQVHRVWTVPLVLTSTAKSPAVNTGSSSSCGCGSACGCHN